MKLIPVSRVGWLGQIEGLVSVVWDPAHSEYPSEMIYLPSPWKEEVLLWLCKGGNPFLSCCHFPKAPTYWWDEDPQRWPDTPHQHAS